MQKILKTIPNINSLLEDSDMAMVINKYGRGITLYSLREELRLVRESVLIGKLSSVNRDDIISNSILRINEIYKPSMKSVINGTGTILHTNLGRAPLGQSVYDDLKETLGYTNIEFNLETGKRGHRSIHGKNAIKYITGAEDVAIVNNNAAAVFLLLSVFGKDRESVVSRGELIEIGGSFRIPDIMESSGSKMVEVGCTNKTHLVDYENAITEETAVIFKAHHSNFKMIGFTEEASLEDLAKLSKYRDTILIYDLGSGLLRKPEQLKDIAELDVKAALAAGADIVCFSGDKLMGGPQAGIIVGKKEYIDRCNKHPLMRSLRVGKLTYSALSTVCRDYLNDETLLKNNLIFSMLSQKIENVEIRANKLSALINIKGDFSVVVSSNAQVGGGTLPDFTINSYSVKILAPTENVSKREAFSEKLFSRLLGLDIPIVSVLKEGYIHIDCFTIEDKSVEFIANSILKII